MTTELKDKVAVVTGASSGIGAQIAVDLALAGASVAVNYRENVDGAAETLSVCEGSSSTHIKVQADVTCSEEVNRLFSIVEERLGPVNILVNNAGGLGLRSQFTTMSEHDFEETIRLNVLSVFLCSVRAVKSMSAQGGGRIVNISSSAARTGGNVGAGAYAAAKAAVNSLTRSFAKECAELGILVNAVAPGVVETRIHQQTPEPVLDSIARRIPLGRLGQPAEVGAIVALLCGPRASYMTGEIVEVNGGLVMS